MRFPVDKNKLHSITEGYKVPNTIIIVIEKFNFSINNKNPQKLWQEEGLKHLKNLQKR